MEAASDVSNVGAWVRWSVTLALTVGVLMAATIGFLLRGERRMTRVEARQQDDFRRLGEQKDLIGEVRQEVRDSRREVRDDFKVVHAKLDRMLLERNPGAAKKG